MDLMVADADSVQRAKIKNTNANTMRTARKKIYKIKIGIGIAGYSYINGNYGMTKYDGMKQISMFQKKKLFHDTKQKQKKTKSRNATQLKREKETFDCSDGI